MTSADPPRPGPYGHPTVLSDDPGAAAAGETPAAGSTPAGDTGGGAGAARRSSGLRTLVEWVVIITVALLGALIIRTVLFQAFYIPSGSMIPTLKINDRILVNKLSYDLHPVHRGDIVVFRKIASAAVSGPEAPVKDLVKRVIGLPGETIQSTPDNGRLEVNGHVLDEPYLPVGTLPGPRVEPLVIPAGHYFVMGDNRDDSADSRVFGPIAKSQIIGRAFILLWPARDFGLL